MPPNKKQQKKKNNKTNDKKSKKNKNNKKSVPKNQKQIQKGGFEGKCSSGGPKMVKRDPPPHSVFQTGNRYPSEDKNALDWNKSMNMSALYPGLPPKPPLEDCVIM